MTSLTAEIPDGTDRSSKVLRVEMHPRSITSGCGSFVVLFNNQDDALNGVFNPHNTVDLKVNNVDFMRGYVDTVRHIVYDREDVFLHLLRVSGRDISQDLENKIHTESYPYNTRIDDLIADALSDVGSTIYYSSSSSESQIAGGYEAKNEFLLNIFRDCMERESYDGYVYWHGGIFPRRIKLIDLSSPPSSGITLKSVVDAADNNILASQPLEYTSKDGLLIKNKIKIIGPRVRDGWTDGNASDWTGGTNTVVANDTTNKKVGAGSIHATFTHVDGVNLNLYLDFSSGLYSKTANYLDWSIYGQEEMMWWARMVQASGAISCRPKLTDTDGNVIEFYNNAWELMGGSSGVWYWLGAPVGIECDIKASLTADRWHYITGSAFNWKIEKLGFYSIVSTIDTEMWIDDMRLPEEMVSISEDPTSQSTYGKRVTPIRKPYIKTQIELDDYAVAVKTIMKDPVEYIKLQADGAAGIISDINKWLPGNTLTINIPRLNINSETWRMVNIDLIVEPKRNLDGMGHDFIATVEAVPQSNKIIGYLFDALVGGGTRGMLGGLDGRIRNLEKQKPLSHLDTTIRGDESYW